MNKYDAWFYVVVFVAMVLGSLCVIGEEEKKFIDVNITNSTIKVEIKK